MLTDEQKAERRHELGAASEALHTAVCQAVALLNRAPEVARCAEGREAHTILRQALADYADAYMDRPTPPPSPVRVPTTGENHEIA